MSDNFVYCSFLWNELRSFSFISAEDRGTSHTRPYCTRTRKVWFVIHRLKFHLVVVDSVINTRFPEKYQKHCIFRTSLLLHFSPRRETHFNASNPTIFVYRRHCNTFAWGRTRFNPFNFLSMTQMIQNAAFRSFSSMNMWKRHFSVLLPALDAMITRACHLFPLSEKYVSQGWLVAVVLRGSSSIYIAGCWLGFLRIFDINLWRPFIK